MNTFISRLFGIFLIALCFSCEYPQRKEDTAYAKDAQLFLDGYDVGYKNAAHPFQKLLLSTQTNQIDSLKFEQAREAYEAYVGHVTYLNNAADLLKEVAQLTPIQVKQLQRILYTGTLSLQSMQDELTKKKAAIHRLEQTVAMKPIRIRNRYYTTNQLDSLFRKEKNVQVKLRIWEILRQTTVGKIQPLFSYAHANNQLVRGSGYGNFFEYKAGAYQLSTQELMQAQQRLLLSLRPLMAELHTYLRYELASRYKLPVPKAIPAHWLNDLAAVNWGESLGNPYQFLNDSLSQERNTWVQEQASNYLRINGYPPLPTRFFSYEANIKTQVYLLDGEQIKIRINPSNTLQGFMELSQTLKQAQYMRSYINPDVPRLLRTPISESFAIALNLETQQSSRMHLLQHYAVQDSAAFQELKDDLLLYEALHYIPKFVYLVGVLEQFEFAVYANNLDETQCNYKWWELYERFMGITVPTTVEDQFCDPLLSNLHQNLAGSSVDQALAIPIFFQLQQKLSQLPADQDEFQFLQSFLYAGASYEFQRFYTEHFGEELNEKAMLTYFEPVYKKLRQINQNRRNTLPKWD